MLLTISPLRDASGQVVGSSTIARDITQRKKAEEALRHANAYNRSLIEASPDPLVTIGPDGRITDVNSETEEVTGFGRSELIGTDFSDYFTQPEHARDGYLQVFREGVVRDFPLEIQHRDGHVTPVLYNAAVYRDESGQVTGVFAAARDITELRRAEAQLRRSEAGLKEAQRIALLGNWELNLTTNALNWSDEIYPHLRTGSREIRRQLRMPFWMRSTPTIERRSTRHTRIRSRTALRTTSTIGC